MRLYRASALALSGAGAAWACDGSGNSAAGTYPGESSSAGTYPGETSTTATTASATMRHARRVRAHRRHRSS